MTQRVAPSRTTRSRLAFVLAGSLAALVPEHAAAQAPPTPPPSADNPVPKSAAPIERIGPNLLRVGNVQVDMARKELSVMGTINDVVALEFIANTKGGFKAYESAISAETNAIDFNLACILIGLDQSRSVVSKIHLEPTPPKGDPVEISVEWDDGPTKRRARAEDLIADRGTGQTLSRGPWVYTGSVFVGEFNAYMADLDGVLIGFVHSPAPIIDSPRRLGTGTYGYNQINPKLNLKPGMQVKLIVRALPR